MDTRPTTHAEQHTEHFQRVNPFGKIPALIVQPAETTDGESQWFGEAAIIKGRMLKKDRD